MKCKTELFVKINLLATVKGRVICLGSISSGIEVLVETHEGVSFL